MTEDKIQTLQQMLQAFARELERVAECPTMKHILDGPGAEQLEVDINNAVHDLKSAVNSYAAAVNYQAAILEHDKAYFVSEIHQEVIWRVWEETECSQSC